MKKISFVLFLSSFVAAPAVAASGKNSVGVNYGLDYSGVFGIQGEFDISSSVNKAPISIQVFWKTGSQNVLGQYEFNPQVSGDLNYNDFGGLTIGANFSF